MPAVSKVVASELDSHLILLGTSLHLLAQYPLCIQAAGCATVQPAVRLGYFIFV